jgi:hypothetical protein
VKYLIEISAVVLIIGGLLVYKFGSFDFMNEETVQVIEEQSNVNQNTIKNMINISGPASRLSVIFRCDTKGESESSYTGTLNVESDENTGLFNMEVFVNGNSALSGTKHESLIPTDIFNYKKTPTLEYQESVTRPNMDDIFWIPGNTTEIETYVSASDSEEDYAQLHQIEVSGEESMEITINNQRTNVRVIKFTTTVTHITNGEVTYILESFFDPDLGWNVKTVRKAGNNITTCLNTSYQL